MKDQFVHFDTMVIVARYMNNRIIRLVAACSWLLLAQSGKTLARDESSIGKTDASEAALIGMCYDTKQDPEHHPLAANDNAYYGAIDEFLASGWSEAVLNKYYRVSRPLHTTQIFVPQIPASVGTEAFGVGKFVKASYYLIHYKGQVSPPTGGVYRFVGLGDNAMDVAVNGNTVLVANLGNPPTPKTKWIPPNPPTGPLGYLGKHLNNGTWFTLKDGETIDLDVLIGETWGDLSAFFLMIEKQGEMYPKDKEGQPILPIFQVAPFNTAHPPGTPENGKAPAFSIGKPWKGIQ
jgi:hypothetical protein